ncbi:hypothetical protein SDJN02_00350 [Cucurbita argyrosperma subsp. argyrosperma]|nr:hypothetical protein SDJN02_00350 [Cucurbita argyrosperma subsp. argyrosperma]
MMSPGPMSEDRGSSPRFRHTPLQIIHMVGNFFRIWSIYSMYRYFSQTGASVVLFLFCCLAPAAIIFLTLQKPWKGKPLSNTQVVPSVINGGITALYFILWGKGLKTCGPLRAILAEYSGAVLGVLSAVLYGRRGFVWKKVVFNILHYSWASLYSFNTLSLVASLPCWYLSTFYHKDGPWPHIFPFISLKAHLELHFILPSKDGSDSKDQTEQDQTELVLGLKEMLIPIFAGILSALRRVIARRVSLKNQLKRRLHAITMASATCFLFPLAMWDMIIGSTLSSDNRRELPFSTWAFLSTIIFGVILIFYVDSIAEESNFFRPQPKRFFSQSRYIKRTVGPRSDVITSNLIYV